MNISWRVHLHKYHAAQADGKVLHFIACIRAVSAKKLLVVYHSSNVKWVYNLLDESKQLLYLTRSMLYWCRLQSHRLIYDTIKYRLSFTMYKTYGLYVLWKGCKFRTLLFFIRIGMMSYHLGEKLLVQFLFEDLGHYSLRLK